MKFSFIALASLASAVALGAAIPEDAAPSLGLESSNVELDTRGLEKRAVTGTVKVDGLRSRTCPRVSSSCPAVGQYAKGTKISLVCYTRVNTTPVNGDKGWGKLTNGNYVALANMAYVSWPGNLYAC